MILQEELVAFVVPELVKHHIEELQQLHTTLPGRDDSLIGLWL